MDLLMLLALLAGDRGQLPPVPSYEVRCAARPVAVDGRLTDDAWRVGRPVPLHRLRMPIAATPLRSSSTRNPDRDWYYGLEMNSRAVLCDYFYAFPSAPEADRVLVVQLAVHRRGSLSQAGDEDEGWSLEVAIRWSNFEELAKKTPPAPGDGWTANLNRWHSVEPDRRLSQCGFGRSSPESDQRTGARLKSSIVGRWVCF